MVHEFKVLHFFLYPYLLDWGGGGGGGEYLILFKEITDSCVERRKNMWTIKLK